MNNSAFKETISAEPRNKEPAPSFSLSGVFQMWQ